MNVLYPISIRGSIDLTKPISLIFSWDGKGASLVDTVDRYQRTLDVFEAHLIDGAFFRGNGDFKHSPTPVEAELLAQQQRLEIVFQSFRYPAQSLRLLIRALLYQHCRVESQVETIISGSPANTGSADTPFVLRTPQDLERPLPEAPIPFQSSTLWCYKHPTLHVDFPRVISVKAAEAMNQIVANWVILGDLGAYATSDQLENFDEDEEIEMLLDLPVVGEDFVEWSVTQLNVEDECVTSLLNLMVVFHDKDASINYLEIE